MIDCIAQALTRRVRGGGTGAVSTCSVRAHSDGGSCRFGAMLRDAACTPAPIIDVAQPVPRRVLSRVSRGSGARMLPRCANGPCFFAARHAIPHCVSSQFQSYPPYHRLPRPSPPPALSHTPFPHPTHTSPSPLHPSSPPPHLLPSPPLLYLPCPHLSPPILSSFLQPCTDLHYFPPPPSSLQPVSDTRSQLLSIRPSSVPSLTMTDVNLSPANEPPPRLHSNQSKLQPTPQEPKLPLTNSALPVPQSSASPPPLKVSESMRRLQDMLSARKLTTADLLTYTHNSVTFSAQILPDGSLKSSALHTRSALSAAPHPQPSSLQQQPQLPHPTQFRLYSSPSEFASDMASSFSPDNHKPRGAVTVNGWNECRVNGRSLAVLRNEMLRSKKTEPSDVTQLPRSAPSQPMPGAAKASPSPTVEPQAPTEATENPSGSQHKPAQMEHRDHNTSDPADGTKRDSEAPKDQLPARTPEKGDQSAGEQHSKSVLEQAEKSPANRHSSGDSTTHPLQTGIDAVTPNAKSTSPSANAEQKRSKVDVEKSDSEDGHARNAILTVISNWAKSDEAPRPAPKPSEPAMAKDKPEEKPASPELDHRNSPESDKGNGRTSTKDPAHKNAKKRMRSPAKQDAKKRKKKNRSDSPPSGARTPGSRKGERRSKEGKTTNLACAVDVDMVELDPEAREAAAIAAQAEKEEANSRSRRTTRLAAGKIKQVDYKASANPQSTRTYSPGQENEDAEGHYHSNEATDAPKSSRRRTNQNHSSHQVRTSRRLTRQRGSYDREMSSNDELDNSGWRSGGNSSDKKHSNHDETDEVIGTSRTNGMRNERKRARPDSRRGRSNHSSDIDRGNNGSRDSPDDASPELPEDDEDMNEEGEMEEDEDPENRTDSLDLNMQDLTCIGIAIKEANTLDPAKITAVIQRQSDWKHDDHKNKVVASYVEKVTTAILHLRHIVSLTEEDITVPQALAFVATDILRLKNGPLKTGCGRRPSAILNRAQEEDRYRTALDRNRRKEQRDADEARASLERDMGSRRKSEMDSLYAEALLAEVMGHVKREEARCLRVEKEIARYEALEADVKARFDKAKLVHEKLHNERRTLETPAAAKKDQHHSQQKEEEVMVADVDGSAAKRRKLSGGPAEKSDENMGEAADDDERFKKKERGKEMARLQALIAARQAEIEDYQRRCVDARLTFNSIADTKSRLETELHVLQSVAFPSHGNSSHGAPSVHYMRSHKEAGRKNEQKSGSGGGRNSGNSRSKPHGRGSGTGTPSRPNGSNKGKSGNGRHGENGNRSKRKTSSKHS
eukprot:TRINITY_DN2062_c0_g1_i1.p1 TRINITY_DN2062_c0_g1~~TRINITY_DN2062_c0_g1_i1.p1  ORF type:complete len:1294 (-),score=230.45 TRINITY_DN2062_c0_g1_i1:549-4430(-)